MDDFFAASPSSGLQPDRLTWYRQRMTSLKKNALTEAECETFFARLGEARGDRGTT